MTSMTQTTCDFSLLGGFRRLLSYGVRELHLSLSALICLGGRPLRRLPHFPLTQSKSSEQASWLATRSVSKEKVVTSRRVSTTRKFSNFPWAREIAGRTRSSPRRPSVPCRRRDRARSGPHPPIPYHIICLFCGSLGPVRCVLLRLSVGGGDRYGAFPTSRSHKASQVNRLLT